MQIDFTTLANRIGRHTLPDPPADDIERRTARILAAMPRHGYQATPASPVIARHIAHIMAARAMPGTYREPRNGLALFGGVGTGKTTALLIIAAATGAEYISVPSLVREYAARGAEWLAWQEIEWRQRDLILDDIGTPEETSQKKYGVLCPVGGIIDGRYDVWRDAGKRLYVSSNLNPEQRAALYDARIISRLGECADKVPCAWPSFRTQQKEATV